MNNSTKTILTWTMAIVGTQHFFPCAPSYGATVSHCDLLIRSQAEGDWNAKFYAYVDDTASSGYADGEDASFIAPAGKGVAMLSQLDGAPGAVFLDARPITGGGVWWGGDGTGPDATLRLERYGYDTDDPPVTTEITLDVSEAGNLLYALFDDDNNRTVLPSNDTEYTVDVPHDGVTLRLHAYLPVTFSSGQNVTGVWKSDAQWGDFDGDGDLDLVIAGRTAGDALVTKTYENQAGTLIEHVNDIVGVESESSGNLAWGDYDGDGDLDLAIAGTADGGRVSRIYKNDGSGTLTWDMAQVLTDVDRASVAWGDYDNDGDLDLVVTGYDGTDALAILYHNEPHGTLSPDPSTPLTGVRNGSVDWGDYDEDGDLDLLLTGYDGSSRRIIFYENDPPGTLTDVGDQGLPGVNLSDTAWGDFDNDGDLDLALTGELANGGPRCARVYRNDAGAFTQVFDFASIYRSSCAWGDYDNDGDLDVAFCGYTGTSLTTAVCANDQGSFSQAFAFPGRYEGSLSWVDIDQDGDLDFFMTGYDWSNAFAQFHQADNGLANLAPQPPTSLSCDPDQTYCGIYLSWKDASDNTTRGTGLYYAVRVGTFSGGNDVLSGTYSSPLLGNRGQANTPLLKVPAGAYYWSVRSIDAGLAASTWAPELFYEHLPTTVYVDAGATGANDGSNWTNAFTDLRAAENIASVFTEFRVAAGTYTPDGGNGDRASAFYLANCVSFYGGFPPGGGTWEERDPVIYETILSGDLLGNDGPDFVNYDDNCFHVVIAGDTNSSAVLDGFIITGGNADGPLESETGLGGGMRNARGSPTIRSCIFRANQATTSGALYNEEASPTVINCAFVGNRATTGGGAVVNHNGSNATLINCAFYDNRADFGGGVYNFAGNSTPTFINCVFSGNTASSSNGGGMFNAADSIPILINCTLNANAASGAGGGMYNVDADPRLTNCILWGNTDSGGMDESAQIHGGTPVINLSIVQGWTGSLGGNGNIGDDPLFVNPPGGDYRLGAGSPAIDAADNTAVPVDTYDLDADGDTAERIPVDLDGLARFFDDPDTTDTGVAEPPDYPFVVDMGAYEFQGGGNDANVIDAKSLLMHGAGPGIELAIDLDDTSGIEPRQGGPQKLSFELSEAMDPATVIPANVQINCAIQAPPAIDAVTLQDADIVVVELAESLADADCCTFAFDGIATDTGGIVLDTFDVIALRGDMNFSGGVTGGDALLIKPHFGEIAGIDLAAPQWDYDRNGGVTGGDFALIKPLLGNIAPVCP